MNSKGGDYARMVHRNGSHGGHPGVSVPHWVSHGYNISPVWQKGYENNTGCVD